MATPRFQARSTMKAVLLALALVITGGVALAVSALAQPQLSDDFAADVDEYNVVDRVAPWPALEHGRRSSIPMGVVFFGLSGVARGGPNVTAATLERPGALAQTTGDYLVDFTGRRSKYTTNLCDIDPGCAVDDSVDIYNFYNNGTSYVVPKSTGACTMHALPAEMTPTFPGLVNATTLATPCLELINSGKPGRQYHLDLADGEVRDFCVATDEKTPYWIIWQRPGTWAKLLFRTYTPGRPSVQLPSSCYQ